MTPLDVTVVPKDPSEVIAVVTCAKLTPPPQNIKINTEPRIPTETNLSEKENKDGLKKKEESKDLCVGLILRS